MPVAYSAYTWTKGTPLAAQLDSPVYLHKRSIRLDMADLYTPAAGGTPALLTVSDTLQILPIPAGSYILGVRLKVVTFTTGGAASTISVGDTGSATRYITTQSIATATDAFAPPTVGLFYPAADYIKLTFGTAFCTGAVIVVSAVMADASSGYGF